MSDATDIAALEKVFQEQHQKTVGLLEKASGQIQETGKVAGELKTEIKALTEKSDETIKRIDKIEAKYDGLSDYTKSQKPTTLGEAFVNSAEFKAIAGGGDPRHFRGRVSYRPPAEVKAIINATGQNQPLVPADRVPRIFTEPQRRLSIRDLIPSARTSSNLIEFTSESTFTDNSGPQAGDSPTVFENVAKGESDATFNLSFVPVTTYAHFIKLSKQVLSDAPQLQGHIDRRMRYFLNLKIETHLVTGDGASGRLRGVYRFGTPYNEGQASGETKLDVLRKAKLQLAKNEYMAEAYILNPKDWDDIEGQKVGGGDGRYIYGSPASVLQPRIWGLPVVVTNSIPEGSFVCGAFSVASTVWDRDDESVSISTEEGNDFTRNMCTVLVETRLAHVIYLTRGLIRGDFAVSPIS